MVAPFVTGIFAADAHDVSLDAGFPRLAALDADGGLVRGLLEAGRAARFVAKRPAGRATGAPRSERASTRPPAGSGRSVDALAAASSGRASRSPRR